MRNLKKKKKKKSIQHVEECEKAASDRRGGDVPAESRFRGGFVSVPVRRPRITPSDIIRPGLKFFLRRTLRPFVEKIKMLKLCKMASPAVADGAAVWEAFRHLCRGAGGSHYPAISQCFRFLVSLKKKMLWVRTEILPSLKNLFWLPFRNTLCNVKKENHPNCKLPASP